MKTLTSLTKIMLIGSLALLIALAGTQVSSQQSSTVHAASSDSPAGILSYSYPIKSIDVKPYMASKGFGEVELFADMINRTKPLAALNGTYFDAYVKDNSKRYPNGLMIHQGKIIRGGTNPSVWIDASNKGRISRLQVKVAVAIRSYKATSKGNVLTKAVVQRIWGINQFWGEQNPSQLVVFTPDWGPRLNINSGVKIVIVQGKVTRITRDPVDIPANGIVYYDGDAKNWDGNRKYKDFVIGDTILLYTSVADLERYLRVETKDIKFAMGAGPIVLRKGKVSIDFKRDGFKDPKILYGDGRRSFIGFDLKGRIVIGSSSRTTIDKLAKNLRKAGIYEAMNLDGGAGSAVYANGKITVNPDRKLSNIILINKKQ